MPLVGIALTNRKAHCGVRSERCSVAEDQARFEELSAAHRTALEAEDIAALEKIQVELAELMKRRTLDLPPT